VGGPPLSLLCVVIPARDEAACIAFTVEPPLGKTTENGLHVSYGRLGRKRREDKATQAAKLIDAAMDKVIAEAKHLTTDLGGKAGTKEMGDAVAAAV
jgi:hypothetical protein